MKETSSLFSRSCRQVELEKQITKALELEDSYLVDLLEAQWVHRYGLETLPYKKQFDSQNNFQQLSSDESNNFLEDINDLDVREVKQTNQDEFLLESKQSNQKISFDCLNEIPLEEIDLNTQKITFNDENNLIDELPSVNNLDEILVSPPPPPTLKKFRRWLPGIEDNLVDAA